MSKMDLVQQFSNRISSMKASEIRELLKLLETPDMLSFAGGIPDPALFPTQAFAQAYADALTPSKQAQALQYSASEGYLPLRQWLVSYMADLGVDCTTDNILITSGSQQALDYLAKLFLNPADTALVGAPTYLGALGAFNAYEPRYDRLDPFDNRTTSEIAQAARQAGGKVKFSYLSPDFANPTGETLSLAARLQVLEQAKALDAAVIEDAAYCGLRYRGEDIPSILALELAEMGDLNICRTIYCGSFSKTLSPGLRVGWVVASDAVISQLVLLKQAGDLHTATINQMAIHGVALDGFADHVTRLRAVYGRRCTAMLSALAREMPDGVTWTEPEGGMFIWLTLPKGMDSAQVLQQAIDQEQMAFVPGRAFFSDGSGRNTLRLNFSHSNEIQIADGITRLGRLLRTGL